MGFRVLKPSFKEYQSLPVVATSTSSIGEGKFAYAATHLAPAASGAGQCAQANSLDPRLAAEDPALESQYGKKHRLTLHTPMPAMSMATSCFGTYVPDYNPGGPSSNSLTAAPSAARVLSGRGARQEASALPTARIGSVCVGRIERARRPDRTNRGSLLTNIPDVL
jgi:hypothetical protein